MAKLADAIDLGSISIEWGFESLYPHQNGKTRTLMKSQSSCFILYVKIDEKKTRSRVSSFRIIISQPSKRSDSLKTVRIM